MKAYHSKSIAYDKPSFCSNCYKVAKGGLLYIEENKKIHSCCSMACQKEIKEKIERGEKLPIKASVNYDSADYCRKRSQHLYKELRQKNSSGDLFNWSAEDRKKFFNWIILEYLNAEVAKSETEE